MTHTEVYPGWKTLNCLSVRWQQQQEPFLSNHLLNDSPNVAATVEDFP
jgi:hypothetical protein